MVEVKLIVVQSVTMVDGKGQVVSRLSADGSYCCYRRIESTWVSIWVNLQ